MSAEAGEQSRETADNSEYIRERAGTELVNQKHVDEFDFDIGRQHRGSSHLLSVNEAGAPGCLGNPHPVKEHGECEICGEHHTRDQSVEAFRADFLERLRDDREFRTWVESLEGQRLACYCVPEFCHGDVILEFLDRGENALLRWENQQLRERVSELENAMKDFTRSAGPAFAKLVNKINEQDGIDSGDAASYCDVDIIPAAAEAGQTIQERGERLTDAENTLQRHETEIENGKAVASDTQGQHWADVVEKAQNVADMASHQLPDEWVILYKDDVASAIQPGKRRASQLIDEWTDTDSAKYKQGTKKQPYQPPSEGTKGNEQRKAIKLDLNVWGEDDA